MVTTETINPPWISRRAIGERNVRCSAEKFLRLPEIQSGLNRGRGEPAQNHVQQGRASQVSSEHDGEKNGLTDNAEAGAIPLLLIHLKNHRRQTKRYEKKNFDRGNRQQREKFAVQMK